MCVLLAVLLLSTGCSPRQEQSERARIALGAVLFHDTDLSADGRTSCASCHRADRAYTDGASVSTGTGGRKGTRNATSLLDSRFMSRFFWDGRSETLEAAVVQPLTNSLEMGMPDDQAVLATIARKAEYSPLVKAASPGRKPDMNTVAASLSAYIRSLPAPPTRFEKYAVSEGASAYMTEDEVEGLKLFSGKAGCTDCHKLGTSPATTSDNRFHHAGIGFNQVAGNVSALLDALEQQKKNGKTLGESILSDVKFAELGRFAITQEPQDLGAFRTPSLRTVALTAPYMHDGSIADLASAVEHEVYYRNLARDKLISLTAEEKHKLVLFLTALSSTDDPPD
ncbi:cytochrome c peroxidase [Xanthomonas sp. 1678]|uniref:cytochrome-c peroxidase n=1 Tax=Xanthomonas sp. 1678 TaxID=3158788 RepID=UPI002865ACA8|nr:cytochrome c peroxidase [Xanthomonas translucens]